MKRPYILLPGLISILLLAILAVAYYVDHKNNPVIPRTPLPAATLAAFQSGSPITNPTQAFVAAQFYLGTTRLRAAGEILPYSAELIPVTEAIARTGIPTDITAYRVPVSGTKVWLVLFAGVWFVEPPIPDPTSTTTEKNTAGAQCVYAILNAGNGMGMSAGGIRDCAAYAVRPAGQIIQDHTLTKGLIALPGSPDIPEALPPTETPRPTQIPPPQPIWHIPVITVPLPISAADKVDAGIWLSASRLQITTQEAHAMGWYWIDFGAGDPLILTPHAPGQPRL